MPDLVERVTVILSPEDRLAVRRAALDEGMEMSRWIRHAIQEKLAKSQPEPQREPFGVSLGKSRSRPNPNPSLEPVVVKEQQRVKFVPVVEEKPRFVPEPDPTIESVQRLIEGVERDLVGLRARRQQDPKSRSFLASLSAIKTAESVKADLVAQLKALEKKRR